MVLPALVLDCQLFFSAIAVKLKLGASIIVVNQPWRTHFDKWHTKNVLSHSQFLAEDIAPSRGKYEYLESQTGISAARWQNLFLRRLMLTVEIILAIVRFLMVATLTGFSLDRRQLNN